ncbi:DNA-directed DNA polymerase [Flavobacteriaceae bacterium UJ101]|nr:DNA-directed DNA polymerase [Flavobacteriaceae bacterium UJ101]
MQIESILNDIKQRKFAPVYFLMGDESYFIDRITKALEKTVLTEEEKGFNQTIVYGKETTIEEVVGAAKQFPMMSEHTLVIVKEAQHLSRTIDKLAHYVENPLTSTVLVFNYKYKTLDKRKKVTKLLSQKAVLFESKRLYENQVPDWIENYLKSKNLQIEPKAKFLLVEFLGTDLARIVNELDKLSILVSGKITVDDIERNIGISKEYNNFELQKALGTKNIVKANQIIHYFGQNPKDNPIVVTLGVLYNYFSNIIVYHSLSDKSKPSVAKELRINPYFVQDYQVAASHYPLKKSVQIVSYLRDADLKSKGLGATNLLSSEILKELLFKILH